MPGVFAIKKIDRYNNRKILDPENVTRLIYLVNRIKDESLNKERLQNKQIRS